MAAAPRVIVAGAGIGGLTAALALSRRGFPVTVLEAAEKVQEAGAGLQLSPNATGVLLALGLGPALKPHAVTPEMLQVMNARSGATIVESRLGVPAAVRYGAPFWALHRGDLQQALLDAVASRGDVDLRLGVRVEEFGQGDGRVVVVGRRAGAKIQFEGAALVGADGLRSGVRARLGDRSPPTPTGRTAWRALVAADAVAPKVRESATTLWLGPDAHVVHYPVRAGAAINVVAIVRENWSEEDFEAPGDPVALRARAAHWAPALHGVVAAADNWRRWALLARPPLPQWGTGPATLLGDAAHPMRPFLAQGAAMAIEDAATLARRLAAGTDDIPAALRAYEAERQPRAARVAAESVRTGRHYGMRGPLAAARNFVLGRMGGDRLLARYDWIYDWKDGQE